MLKNPNYKACIVFVSYNNRVEDVRNTGILPVLVQVCRYRRSFGFTRRADSVRTDEVVASSHLTTVVTEKIELAFVRPQSFLRTVVQTGLHAFGRVRLLFVFKFAGENRWLLGV